MKWLEWKNTLINIDNIYFSNDVNIYNNEIHISYNDENLHNLKYYRTQEKDNKCGYLIIKNTLNPITYKEIIKDKLKQQHSEVDILTKSNIKYIKTQNPLLVDLENDVNELLEKRENEQQNKTIKIIKQYQHNNQAQKTNNRSMITTLDIIELENYSQFLSKCYKYKYICLDLNSIPKTIFNNFNINDFIYKCLILNIIPIFITNNNIPLKLKVNVPYIIMENIEKLVNGLTNKNMNDFNSEFNNNIPYIVINKINKYDYDLDAIINKGTKEGITTILNKNSTSYLTYAKLYFQNMITTNNKTDIKYTNIILDPEPEKEVDDLTVFIKFIYYMNYLREIKPRFILKNNNSFLLDLCKIINNKHNIHIPFYYEDSYDNHHSHYQPSMKEILNSFKTNPPKCFSLISHLITNTNTNTNTSKDITTGIHFYYDTRFSNNKLKKYTFLNEVYYILCINVIINNYIMSYEPYLKHPDKYYIPNLKIICFSKNEYKSMVMEIMENIIDGFVLNSNIRDKISYVFINDFKENQQDIKIPEFLYNMFILSNLDNIIISNTKYSLISAHLFNYNKIHSNTKVGDVFYPTKWFIEDTKTSQNFLCDEWLNI